MTDAAVIKLTQGRSVLVDAADWEFLSQWKWHYQSSLYTGYAKRNSIDRKTIRMHRVIMGAGRGETVDHINGNGLDNRRCNLRVVSHAINCQNRVNLRKDNTSGCNGVVRRGEVYRAFLNRFGKRIWIGTFPTREEAYQARKKWESSNDRK